MKSFEFFWRFFLNRGRYRAERPSCLFRKVIFLLPPTYFQNFHDRIPKRTPNPPISQRGAGIHLGAAPCPGLVQKFGSFSKSACPQGTLKELYWSIWRVRGVLLRVRGLFRDTPFEKPAARHGRDRRTLSPGLCSS